MADTITPTGRGSTTETVDYPGDAGNYDDPGNNYAAGQFDTTVLRDYFNFTIPDGDWTSATLELDEPATGHSGGDTTFSVYSLSSSPGSGEVAYPFASLGSGTFYGSVNLSTSDNGNTIDIDLNSAAIADILSYAGGTATFNIAGVDSGETSGSLDFGNSGGAQSVLILSDDAAAPEPGSITLMGLGLITVAMGALRKKRFL